MTTGPSREYANKHLQLADESLSDAKYLLQDNRRKDAANRAYYAMFRAVQAALANLRVRPPKTHSGAINLFGKHFVTSGAIERRFAKNLQDAYDLRQQTDYEIHADIGEDRVRDMVEKAEEFVAAVKGLVATE